MQEQNQKKGSSQILEEQTEFFVHGEIQFNGKNVLQKSDLNSVVK